MVRVKKSDQPSSSAHAGSVSSISGSSDTPPVEDQALPGVLADDLGSGEELVEQDPLDEPTGSKSALAMELQATPARDRSPRPAEPHTETAVAETLAVPEPDAAAEPRPSRFNQLMARVPREMPRELPRLPDPPSLPGLPNINLLDRLQQAPYMYCEKLYRFPWAFVALYAIIVVVVISAGWREVTVNTDIDAFRQVDGPAAYRHDVYMEALKYKRAVRNGTHLSDRTTFELQIVYKAKFGKSVFDEAVLRDIRAFEHKLRSLDGWRRLCGMADPRARFRCEPGESLGNYVWPRRLDQFLTTEGQFRLTFDGSARERLPIGATLTYLREGAAAPHTPWKFLPETFSGPEDTSETLRSLFTFTAPSLNDDAFRREYEDFVATELYPALLEELDVHRNDPDADSWDSPKSMLIYFHGDVVDDHEVRQVLESDMRLAAGALVLALLITYVHQRSASLAFASLLILCMAVLLAYLTVPVQEVSLASFLVVFLVFGFGGNSLYCLHDAWEQSREAERSTTGRVMMFYYCSGLQLMPVVATAVIFFVYLLSKMKPLREFGLLMGTCMLWRSVLSVMVYVPLLMMHERWIQPLHDNENLPRRAKLLLKILEPDWLKPPWEKVSNLCMQAARRGKILFIVLAVISFIVFIPTVIVAAVRDGPSLPEVFAPSHHRSAGRPLTGAFAPNTVTEEAAPVNTTMCEPWRRNLGGDAGCGLHWCDAQLEPLNTEDGCRCFHKERVETVACSSITVEATISGVSPAVNSTLRNNALEAWIRAEWPTTEAITGTEDAANIEMLPSLVLEHWETGRTSVEGVHRITATATQSAGANARAGTDCTERLMCYCGLGLCLESAMQSNEALTGVSRRLEMPNATSETRRLAPELYGGPSPFGRRLTDNLQATQANGLQKAEIIIVFGITPPESGTFIGDTPEWAFDPTFEPESPWAQRNMREMCLDFPADLRAVDAACWIIQFREWLTQQGRGWPVRRNGANGDFQDELKRFLLEYKDPASMMWMNEEGNMRATSFHIKVTPGADAWAALQDRERWDAYVAMRNAAAATTASQAWASSQAWVEAEAYDEALSSAWGVTVLAMFALLLAGFAYTLDFEIVGIILGIVILACLFLTFFMFCMFQWAFGPWELIILTVFLANSVEPAFRIGRDFVMPPAKYNEPLAELRDAPAGEAPADAPAAEAAGSVAEGEAAPPAPSEDNERVSEADPARSSDAIAQEKATSEDMAAAMSESISSVCNSLVAGAIKLFLCGILLLPCQLRLFTRLGAVAILVPMIALPCTLVVLPAAILLSGRTRREPDVLPLGRYLFAMAAWLWS